MNNGLKALLIAAGIIITCIVAGLAFQNTREGKAQASSAFAQFNTTMSEYQDLGKSMYDGLLVSGAEVRSLIESSISAKEYVQIKVLTGDGTEKGYVYETFDEETKKLAKESKELPSDEKGSDGYINSRAVFLGSIEKDENGIIVQIAFEQQ
ncbi:MAG: hypothetical protein IJW37_05975 [Lachnospiraceae bacterium]|nr:hypothetical protein [Lachnospiraceae bacterium]